MTKYDRMVKRKAKRQSDKNQANRDKEQHKEHQKQPTWRGDKNGNWILKNKIRFSYIGIFVTIIVVIGLSVFAYGVGQIWLTDYCKTTEFVACGFVEQEVDPNLVHDFAPPTSSITEERELP